MSHFLPQLYSHIHEFQSGDCQVRIGIEVVRNTEERPETSDLPAREMFTMREAILQMQEGVPVRRSDWKAKKHISLANSGRWLFRQDGRRYTPTADDILADDWETA